MRDIVVSLIIFGALPLILARPWIGILVWNWIGIMNPHRLGWGFASNMPFAYIVGITTLIGSLFSSEPKRFPLNAVTTTLLTFIGWWCLSTILAIDLDNSLPGLVKALKIQVVILLGLVLMQNRQRIEALTWTLVVSIGFYGVKGGLFTISSGGHFMVLGPPDSYISGNTEIGLAMVTMLPLMRYLQLGAKKMWHRVAIGGGAVLTAIAFIGTSSRGALLAGGAMLAFLWLKSRQKLLLTVIMVAAVPVVLLSMPESWWEKMNTIKTYEKDASAMGRINAWTFAINLATDRPLTGGGFDTFTPQLFLKYAPDPLDFHDAHSIYFEVLGEQGFVGLGLYFLLMLLTWRTGTRIIKMTRNRPEATWAHDLAAMVQVSLVGFWVGGAFLGLAYWDGYYIMISLLILTEVVVKREFAITEQAAKTPAPGGMPASADTPSGAAARNA